MKDVRKMQIDKARAAARFGGIVHRDSPLGRGDKFVIPGSNGNQYDVELIFWDSMHTIYTTCHNGTPCKGNSHAENREDVICYHSLAALIISVRDKGCKIAFYETFEEAESVKNLGGKIRMIASNQGTGKLWARIWR